VSRTLVVGPDNFTGTTNTHIGTYSANWFEQDDGGGNGTIIIKNNGYTSTGGTTDAAWQGTGSFTDDQYFEITLPASWGPSDADRIGGTLRDNGAFRGSRNMYRVFFCPSLGGVRVDKVVADVVTTISTVLSATFATGDKFSAEAVTNGANVDIKIYKDTGSGPSLLGTRTDTSSVLTGGKPGITAFQSAGSLIGDDFTSGNVTSGPAAGLLFRNYWWGNQ
jgi:hypothetical protein